ncbi:MAG: cell envelope integrity protein CreD [Treponema sp.]|nr:cell envelope integrity protein CreD [Treponema sp.]
MSKPKISNSTLKIIFIGAMTLLFLIPIALIKHLIDDRTDYRREAIDSITEPLGRNAEIQGLVIAVPYLVHKESVDSKGVVHQETETQYAVFAPETYNMDIEVAPYYLSRGIFKVPVFNGKIEMDASFKNFDFSIFKIEQKDVLKKDAVLILGLSNTKNLTSQPKFVMNGKSLEISPVKYDSVSPFKNSVSYSLSGVDFYSSDLKGTLEFQGGEKIKITPLALENVFKMKSDWKSPSFSGGWLPTERKIDDNGFDALWKISGLSTVYPKSWLSSEKYKPETVDISFMVPVNAYKKTERSVKYALLFLIIPFIALLIAEIFSKTKIHPVQYCLIGLADVIFYLLLLSISEHIPFDFAYIICSFSVCLATLFYASSIFKKIKWGGLLSGVQFVSYIFLYGTLQAEDYALLIGSIGLFVVVVLLMFITRKIDWYNLNENLPAKLQEENKQI